MYIISKIETALTAIPQLQIANFFSDFHLLYRNLGVTDAEDLVCFSDSLGNYAWIEKAATAKVSTDTQLSSAYSCQNIYTATTPMQLFFVGRAYDSEKLANFIAAVIGSTSEKVRILAISYDLQNIIETKLKDFEQQTINDTIIRFCDYSVVRIDFTFTDTLPIYALGCAIDICKTC